MENGTGFIITNNKDLQALFNDLNDKERKKVFVKTLKDSANTILQKIGSNLSNLTQKADSINKSLGIKPLKGDSGILLGYKTNNEGWKAIFFEGTKDRFTKGKKGKKHSTGKMTTSNFFNEAVESTADEAINNISSCFETNMNKLISKYNK